MGSLRVILIPPTFGHRWFRLPDLKNIGNPMLKPEGFLVPDVPAKDIELLPFMLETGAEIRAGYDEENGTVIITGHPDLSNGMAIGLAANYIEFILTMPKSCRY